MDERRTNTRELIRTVALEMFAEHGYDGTSLREIAERLGVTKAAVYYHFQTKQDILVSLLADYLDRLDELVAWAAEQPPSAAVRRTVLDRYTDLLDGESKAALARFMQEGQPAIRELAAGLQMRKHFEELVAVLATPDLSAEGKLRAKLALVAQHMAALNAVPCAGAPTTGIDQQQELRDAGRRIGVELLAGVAAAGEDR